MGCEGFRVEGIFGISRSGGFWRTWDGRDRGPRAKRGEECLGFLLTTESDLGCVDRVFWWRVKPLRKVNRGLIFWIKEDRRSDRLDFFVRKVVSSFSNSELLEDAIRDDKGGSHVARVGERKLVLM